MPESQNTPFRTYKQCLIDTYGAPLHRVPIDLGFGCPHRNADGSGGCSFCAADGSRARYTANEETLEGQIRAGVAFARTRYGATRFMAYVQAFTGTFAPASTQRDLYARVLGAFGFDAISIATRPDCLPVPTLDVLDELRRRLDVWVELGIQTVHDETLRRINRGHTWADGEAAILALHARGIRVAAHVILGLPGETPAHFQATAEALGRLPVEAVKIHNLHVIRGTPLAREYALDPFPVYDEPAYAELLIAFLRRLPARMAIMRINTDTPEADLVAPRWRMNKARFRRYVVEVMTRRAVRQGDQAAGGPPAGQELSAS